MKHIIALLILLSISTIVYAEICPSVADIRINQLHDWLTFSSDNGAPTNNAMLAKFKKNITAFAMAEWAQGAPEGENHCYYATHKQPYADVFLAKHGLRPDLSFGNWQNRNGFLRCRDDIATCRFIAVVQTTKSA